MWPKCGQTGVHRALFDRARGARSKRAQYFPRAKTCGSGVITLQSARYPHEAPVQTVATLQSDRAGPTGLARGKYWALFDRAPRARSKSARWTLVWPHATFKLLLTHDHWVPPSHIVGTL